MKIKILRNPYSECSIKGLILEAFINSHGAYGVKAADLYAQGVAPVFNNSEVVFFPARYVEEQPTVETLGRMLKKANELTATYYKWYLDSCNKVEKLLGELENERRKNSPSDTK